MVSTTVDRPASQAPVAVPSFVGQGTAIEQSRAIAEVQAAVVVAQQRPRNVQYAIDEMKIACTQIELAERSFYRYRRGGQQVTGPSIHLARELARCWGNMQFNVSELRRDHDAGQSEVMAWAWDLQTNTRASAIFIVPHQRDTTERGRVALPELRDIYENNANMGARRMREQIWAVLPVWFREQAVALCHQTIAGGGKDGPPLPQRISNAVGWYRSQGISADQLEAKLGRSTNQWTEYDVAQLGVIKTSLERGEVTREEEFPPPRVSSDEIRRTAPAEPDTKPATAQPTNAEVKQEAPAEEQLPNDEPLSRDQRNEILARFRQLHISDRATRLALSSSIVQRGPDRQLKTANELSAREAGKLIETLRRALSNPEPLRYLEQLLGLNEGDVAADEPPPADGDGET